MSIRYSIFLLIYYIIKYTQCAGTAASVTAATIKIAPATLTLPEGFDSQSPPNKPMLYPYALTNKPAMALITIPGWIPLSESQHQTERPISNLASSTKSIPLPYLNEPILEYNIPELTSSPQPQKASMAIDNDPPAYESIIYGTWKPDPPQEPVQVINATTIHHHLNVMVDGSVYNKTINRQHGGFLDNIRKGDASIDDENYDFNNSKSSLSSPLLVNQAGINSREPIENVQQRPKKLKKQGRRKIRPNNNSNQTRIETTVLPTQYQEQFKEQQQYSNQNHQQKYTTGTANKAISASVEEDQLTKTSKVDAIELKTNYPRLIEVVKQINDSVEIQYNHKIQSAHSIEMTSADEPKLSSKAISTTTKMSTTSTLPSTTPPAPATSSSSVEFFDKSEPVAEIEEDDGQFWEDISVKRRNWPIDFMSSESSTIVPYSSTSTEEDESAMAKTTSSTIALSESTPSNENFESSDIPLALSAFNIPLSLWPKLPGNITKVGDPYEAEDSAEEPALCVPITVRQRNMIDSMEVVNVERVYCFPMPSPASRQLLKYRKVANSAASSKDESTAKTGLRNSVTNAKVQKFDDYTYYTKSNTSIIESSFFLFLGNILLVFVFKYLNLN